VLHWIYALLIDTRTCKINTQSKQIFSN